MQLWILSFQTFLLLFLSSFVLNGILTFVLKSKKGSQALDYHYHLDTRPGLFCGNIIPNYWDVVSNLIFAVFGLLGFVICLIYLPSKIMTENEKYDSYFRNHNSP